MSNRHQRRQLQHKLSKLEAQRAQAHARLIDAETRRDRTVAETLAEIEQYVDVLAQEVAVDEKRDLGAGPDDSRIYAVIATVGWRGAPTVQWMVRGHYRMQAHGPKHALRRKQWIRPFWRGNEAALIQTRPKMPGGKPAGAV